MPQTPISRQPASAEPSFNIVKPEQLAPLAEEVGSRIARRAYELFEARGRQHGEDLGDWLQAESELLEPIDIAARELEEEVEVIIALPSISFDKLIIGLDSRQVILTTEARDGADHSTAIFRAIHLPAEVDFEHIRAAVAKRRIYLALPKARRICSASATRHSMPARR